MKEVPLSLAHDEVKIRVGRLLPIAGGLLAPLVLIPLGWADAIAEVAEWIGNAHVMALAAAANALTIIP